MELKRKVYDKMLEWKKNPSRHKALIIEGLRQIGKSYIVEKFAKEQYDNAYFFDFRKNANHRDAFKGSFNLNDFKTVISVIFGRSYDDSNGVLVFDEIGDSPDARAAIKYIIKETNFDVIATGSLLGVKGFSSRAFRSPSVGSEDFIMMHPLDFEEFLWANGIGNDVITSIKSSLDSFNEINPFIHERLEDLFKSYIAIGGMPETVILFLEKHDYYESFEKNSFKLREMEGDFGRVINSKGEIAIDSDLLIRTREVYNSLPAQLAKDNTKFQYSQVKKGGRAKEYEKAIGWLIDSGLVCKCSNLTDIGSPLSMYAMNDIYKLYLCDTGLLLSLVGFTAITSLLQGSLSTAGGFIYENVVASTLIKEDMSLYYSDNGVSELDFIIEKLSGPTILEVKKGNYPSKSAKAVMEGRSNRHASYCYKIRSGNFGKGDYYDGLPHYALSFLLEKIKKEIIDFGKVDK